MSIALNSQVKIVGQQVTLGPGHARSAPPSWGAVLGGPWTETSGGVAA